MFVGRHAELQSAQRLIASARLGRGGTLLITGEPGAGKTALLDAVTADLAGTADTAVLRAGGSESEREVPFGGLSQLLRPALADLAAIPPPQAAALRAALALRAGPAPDRFAVGAATLSLLCRYAEEASVVVVVDDVQWWDRPSLEALAFAAHRLALDPVAVLAGARTLELDPVLADLPTVELTGLAPHDAATLLAATTQGATLHPDLVGRLHRATAGNPLALVELARNPDALLTVDPEVPLPVPATVTAAFVARARALSVPARRILVVLAVADGDLRTATEACRVMNLDLAAVAEAEAAGLIEVRPDRASFRHPLVRSAVYADADPAWRRDVHRAVAAALAAEDIDRHAWHLAEATVGADPGVADLLDAAARRAGQRSAHAVAAAAYKRAAALSPDPRDRRLRRLSAAESAWRAGNAGQAESLIEGAGLTAMPEPGADPGSSVDPELVVRTLRLRGAIAQRTGAPRVARGCFQRAADLTTNPELAVELLADAIYSCYFLADVRAAQAAADRIDALLDTGLSSRALALGRTASGAARMLANAGGAQRLRTGLASLGATTDDETTMLWLLTGLLFLRDQDSQPAIQRLVDRARSRAAVSILPLILFLLARNDATTDRWQRAEVTYLESISLAQESGNVTDAVMSATALAWLLARQGREPDAAVAALPTALGQDIPVAQVWLMSATAERELAAGRFTEALAGYRLLADRLVTLRIDDPDLYPGAELTEALLRLGRRDDAAAAAADFADRARAKGLPWVTARAHRAVGLCADDDELDAEFAAALAAHAHTLDRFEEARTQLAYGERLRRGRRRADARGPLTAALASFDTLAARPWADRAATELAATGAPVRRSAQPLAAALTPQELRIASHLAEGRTIREVAAALFLSPKTVEYHLRKVYTKLGVRTRADLAALLPR